MGTEAFDQPLEITTVDGEVVITGPAGLSASLTVEAARASAERLLAVIREIEDDGALTTHGKPAL